MRILSLKILINEIFSKQFFINLGTLFGRPNLYTGAENPLHTPTMFSVSRIVNVVLK